MVAYRFCRPDDIPLLVRALNECWLPHAGGEAMTEEGFRGEMKRLDVWPSNSMVALDGAGTPVAVSIGTKRPDSVLVHRVAARPGHERQGHGRHLVTSLSQKLAVLGPERLEAEVPAAEPAAVAFFEALGWQREVELTDRLRAAPGGAQGQPVPDDLVVPMTVDELEGAGALAPPPSAPWQRRLPTLRARAGELVGIGVVTPDSVEAWVVSEAFSGEPEATETPGTDAPVEILAAGCRDPSRADFLLGLLFRWLSHTARRPLRMARVAPGEMPPGALTAAGFEAAGRHLRYSSQATPL